MNLRQLEVFVKAAEEQNFSKAANALFLSQPTVSAHISSLEKELNTRLFVRNTRSVRLTDSGEKLYQYAREMMKLEHLIREEFQMEKACGSCLRIAASTIPAQYLLPEILAKYSEKYPGEQFWITESDSAKVVKAVTDRTVDLGFTGTVLDKSVCTYEPFYEDELIMILPNNEKYRKIMEQESTLDWIEKEPVIMRENGSGTRREAEKQLKAAGVDISALNIVADIENTETIKRSVENGMGITILSRLAAQETVDSGTVLEYPLGNGRNIRQLYMVYNKEYSFTQSVKRMMKIVRNIYK